MTEYYWKQRGTLDEWRLLKYENIRSFVRLIRRDGKFSYELRPYGGLSRTRLEGITTLEDAQAVVMTLVGAQRGS